MSTLDIPFAVNILHQRIIARLVHYSPQYSSVSPRQPCPERHATPVYISLGRDFRQKSIPLRSFRIANTSGGRATYSSCSIGNSKAASNNESQPNHTALAIKRLLGNNSAPKVLLAINLQGEHWLNFENQFGNWLKDMPLPADSINIEAVFHGLSTVILLSMPIAVWDLLPEHPSCSFVNFVQSPNLLPAPMSLCCLSPSKGEEIVHVTNNILDSGLGLYLSRLYLVLKEKSSGWSVSVGASIPRAKWLLLTSSVLLISLVLFFNQSGGQYGRSSFDVGDAPALIRKSKQCDFPHFKDLSTVRCELIESLGTGIFPIEGSIAHGAPYASTTNGAPDILADISTTNGTMYVMSCIATISVCAIFFLYLEFPELPRISEMRSGSQEYQKKNLRCFIRILTPKDLWPFIRVLTLDYTFAIAMIDVMDSALSAGEMREWAHKDGVRWTPGHSRYAAMGGFVVQPPITNPSEGLQRPLQLSSRALLQMRRAGVLEKLPDINMTQVSRKKNRWTGNLLISVTVFSLVPLSIRWIANDYFLLEIIPGVFAIYTVIIYTLVGDDMFSRRPSTALSLHDVEDFWYRIGKGGGLRRFISLQPSPSHALWTKVATHRRLQNYPIDRPSVSFWLGLWTAYLISGALQVIVWNGGLLTPVGWKANVLLWSFYFLFLVGVNYREIWFSVRIYGVLAGVGLILGSALVLHRLFLVLEVIPSVFIFG